MRCGVSKLCDVEESGHFNISPLKWSEMAPLWRVFEAQMSPDGSLASKMAVDVRSGIRMWPQTAWLSVCGW